MDVEARKASQIKYGRLCYRIAIGLAGLVLAPGVYALVSADDVGTMVAFAVMAAAVFAVGWALRFLLAGEGL